MKLKFTAHLQMASLSLYLQSETNFMSNRKVIELLLQLKSAKAHGKNYIKVKPHLVRHRLRNCLLSFLVAGSYSTFVYIESNTVLINKS